MSSSRQLLVRGALRDGAVAIVLGVSVVGTLSSIPAYAGEGHDAG